MSTLVLANVGPLQWLQTDITKQDNEWFYQKTAPLKRVSTPKVNLWPQDWFCFGKGLSEEEAEQEDAAEYTSSSTQTQLR